MTVLEKVSLIGIMPVINIPSPNLAIPLVDALAAGGLPQIEVTLRNDTALDSIQTIKAKRPGFICGAGTVLSVSQAEEALAAGADFIVTPGFNSKVVEYVIAQGAEILPGCVTPAEIEVGMALGLSIFKFFPAESMGGIRTIRELCGPYRSIRFVPTSGITMDNLASYLSFRGVACVGGSCMAPATMVTAEDFDGITLRCREAVRRSLGFAIRHVGINCGNPEEGVHLAQRFATIFDFPYLEGERSDFAGTAAEFCKDVFPGAVGHIAISTLSVERAAHYLIRKGVALREDFCHTGKDGRPDSIYLAEEFAGFAVHILQV